MNKTANNLFEIKWLVQFLAMLILLFMTTESASSLSKERKKVAVVLSGGGAKGAAHIGALKVIEEAGIPVDIVVGTSMGSIVGGLYAIGYTSAQLDSMVKQQDWSYLLSDKVNQQGQSLTKREQSDKYSFSIPLMRNRPKVSGLIRGENINTLFSELTVGYHNVHDFNELPRKFSCVATNMETGEEYVFHSGKLPVAMRASMAIPGVFTPVVVDSLVLADGGLCNNYPADVAKQMGADIIIGVSVHQELRRSSELTTMYEILSQVVDIACRNKLEENVAMTDLFVHVDAAPYSTASFQKDAIDSLIVKGETTMRQHWTELLELKSLIADSLSADSIEPYNKLDEMRNVFIENITFIGTDLEKSKRLLKRCQLYEQSKNSLNQIKYATYILRDEFQYSDVSYQLIPQKIGYDLVFNVSSKKDINLNLGIRYDTEDNASLLVGGSLSFDTPIPSSLGISARLGNRFLGQIKYTLTPTLMKHFSVIYSFIDNDVNVHYKGERAYNLSFQQHQLELRYTNVWWRNFQYDLGVKFDGFTKPDILRTNEVELFDETKACKFVNYYLRIKYNSMDNAYFPTHGVDFWSDYTVYTDNFYQRRKHTPFSAISGNIKCAIPLARKSVLQPFIRGRFLIGKNVSPYYSNFQGGVGYSTYFDQQLPMDGIYNLEYAEKALLHLGTKIQQRITGQHYLTLAGTLFSMSHDVENIFHKAPYYGISLGYGWQSMIGPLQAFMGYSNYSEYARWYINVGYYF